ncbi:hypothetical protein [Cellulomonas alba]|uniref:Lipoprotein n=1 Tax=Cellulomonas alba TaxID=3053467 RepID=A0ABT7SG46_9CELL|nr:hypothetical protein [Cellulomonas alba]MDM7854522.1 hypothetical protein [Cellulomonas alba]
MRHRSRLAITAAIALVVLTGCSSGGGDSGTPAPPAATSAPAARPERTAGDLSSPGTAACQAARSSVARDTATQWSQVTGAQHQSPDSAAVAAAATSFAMYWQTVLAEQPAASGCFTDVTQAVDDLARAAQRGGRIDDEVAAVDAAVSSLAGS